MVVERTLLPSQFDLTLTFDEALGLHRARRGHESVVLLRICESDQFSLAIKEYCQDWVRQNAKLEVPGLWSPSRAIASKQAGTFVIFDDLAAMSLEQILGGSGEFDVMSRIPALKHVACAIDYLHQQRIPHGNISSRTVLCTEKDEAILVDTRLHTEIAQLLGTHDERLPSIQDDRLAFVALLEECCLPGTHRRRSASGLSNRAIDLVRGALARIRSSPSKSCEACLETIETTIRNAGSSTEPVRWKMVVDFLDEDQSSPTMPEEAYLELPRIRSDALETATVTQGDAISRTTAPQDSRLQQSVTASRFSRPNESRVVADTGADIATSDVRVDVNVRVNVDASERRSIPRSTPEPASVSPQVTVAQPSGPSNKVIGIVFLFSVLTLGGVVAFKVYGPQHGNVNSSPVSGPMVLYQTQQIRDVETALAEAESKAKDTYKLNEIAPHTWKQATQEAAKANQFLKLLNSADFMATAPNAIQLFETAKMIAMDHQTYMDLVKTPPVLKDDEQSVPIPLRQQLPAEYQLVFDALSESEQLARKEKFDQATSKLKEARDKVAQIEPQARLKAANTAIRPAEKLTLLLPVLNQSNVTAEVVEIVSGIFEKSPELWRVEAKRRIGLLGPVESIAATCELARASAAMKDGQLATLELAQAIETVEALPDASTDPQAATAAIRLLEVVGDDVFDSQKLNATSRVAKWAEAKLTDPIDLSIVAGHCYRLGDLPAWGRLTNASQSNVTAAETVDDVVGVNFVIANSGASNFSGLYKLTSLTEKSLLASVMAAQLASTRNTSQAVDLFEKAAQIASSFDPKNQHCNRAQEILAALEATHGRQIRATTLLPASRLFGLAAAIDCQHEALTGDFQVSLKKWDQLPARSLVKTDATLAIGNGGMRQQWKPADAVRWSFSHPSDFDIAIACIANSNPSAGESAQTAPSDLTRLNVSPGTVLVWNLYQTSIKSSRGTLRSGGFGGGAKNSKSPPMKAVPKMRFFVRSVNDQAIAGFLEKTPGNELYYCTGTCDEGILICQAEPLIPLNNRSKPAIMNFSAILGERYGIAVMTGGDGGSKLPAIAGFDSSQNTVQATPLDRKRLEELEARLLVSSLANGQSEGGQPNPVMKWSVPPIIVIRGTADQKRMAIECLSQLGDRKLDCPFARFEVRDKPGKNDTHGLLMIFDKTDKHASNAKAIGIPWNSSGPLGYWVAPDDRNQIKAALLQIDPDAIAAEKLRVAIQHLWIRSFGFNFGRDKPISMGIDSTFTTETPNSDWLFKPLRPIDHTAIRIFLEDVDIGSAPEKIRWNLFMRDRDLWAFP